MKALPPLSRPTLVTRLPPGGLDATVEASEAERAALAADLDLVAVLSLSGTFHLVSRHGRVRVNGRVTARVEQTCVVSLDPFEAAVDEEVDVSFDEHAGLDADEADVEHETDLDAPDPIVDGRIDLGVLTAEFLAMGLDPYPRKPGAVFAPENVDSSSSPFASLASLRRADE